jgi:hypothetical protein
MNFRFLVKLKDLHHRRYTFSFAATKLQKQLELLAQIAENFP